MKSTTTLLLSSLILVSCGRGTQKSCDTECKKSKLNSSEVRLNRFWSKQPKSESIVKEAPQELIEYINLDNAIHGYKFETKRSDDKKFFKNIKTALDSLPSAVKKLVAKKLIGIFPVRNLGTSGYTEKVFDPLSKKPVGGFILLDESFGSMPINKWATKRENMPFKKNGPIRITARFSNSSNASVVETIRYVLLHELGHILAIGGNFHPPWGHKGDLNLNKYPFLNYSWELNGNQIEPKLKEVKSFFKNVSYYRKAKLNNQKALEVFKILSTQNFPSLYGVISPYEDFADSFASYVHCVVENKPYEVTIKSANKPRLIIDCCWKNKRCSSKKKFFDSLIIKNDVPER